MYIFNPYRFSNGSFLSCHADVSIGTVSTDHLSVQPTDVTFNRLSSTIESETDSLTDQSEPPTLQSTQSKTVKTILSQFLPSGPMLSPILVN